MKQNRKKPHTGRRLLLLAAVFLFAAVPWALRYENLRPVKNCLNTALFDSFPQKVFQAEALLAVDCSDGDDLISKRPNEQLLPASLAKLFVIDYAATLIEPDAVIPVSREAIALTKPGSSVAHIAAKDYYAKNLYAAMLVPSGNDAAYALADYCGGILSPQTEPGAARVRVFMDSLNGYLRENGCLHTVLYDPSGYDEAALTTVTDLKTVAASLLKRPWFRETVSQSSYTAALPDGSRQSWKNTNAFLNASSDYYEKDIVGVKTGSFGGCCNLVVLYRQHGKEFLICSLGSPSDSARYDDVSLILRTIDRSNYAKGRLGKSS